LIADIQRDIVNLCAYDQERCDGWKQAALDKARAEAERKSKEQAEEALKGTDKDPSLKQGPGGPIPRGKDEIEAERLAKADKAELDAAKAKEKGGKGGEKFSTEEACVKCNESKKKKDEKEVKMRSEKYDDKYKNETSTNWNDRDHSRKETVPNPTVTKLEKEAISNGTGKPIGKNTDGDNRKLSLSAKPTEARVQLQTKNDIKGGATQNKIGNYFASSEKESLKDGKSKKAETKK